MQQILEAFEPLTEDEITANKFILFAIGTLSNKREYIDPETKEILNSNNIGYDVVSDQITYYNDNWRLVRKTLYLIRLYNKTNRKISLQGVFDYNRTTGQLELERVLFRSKSYSINDINKYRLLHALTVNRPVLRDTTKNPVSRDARRAYDYYRKFTNEPVEIPFKSNYMEITADKIIFNKQNVKKIISEINALKDKLYDIERNVRDYDGGAITKAKDEWNKEYINVYKAFNADKHKAAPYNKRSKLDE